MDQDNSGSQLFPKYQQNNVTQPATPQVPQLPPKKSKAGLIVVIVIILIVVGAIAAYAMGYIKLPFGGEPSPKNAVLSMAETLTTVKSVSFNGSAEVKIKESKNAEVTNMPTGSFTVTAVGSLDMSDKETPKGQIDTGANFSISDEKNGSMQGEVTLGMIGYKKDVYLSLKNFDFDYQPVKPDPYTAGMIGFAEGFVSSIKGKWIKIESQQNSPSPTNEEDTATFEKLKKALAKMDYVDSIKKINEEKVSGVATRHYSMIVDSNKLNVVVSEALGETPQADMVKSFKITGLEEGKIVIDLWIGKQDNRLYKIATPEMIVEDETTKVAGSVVYEISFKDYNKPLELSAPSDSITIEELMGSLMSPNTAQKAR